MRYVPDGVPVANLHMVWSGVWPFLQKAIDRFPKVPRKYTEGDILAKLFSRDMQLWLCWDCAENRAVGALITEVSHYDTHRDKVFLSIPLVGGEGWNTWGDSLWTMIKSWGIEKGCTHALGYGRRGWMRLYGFVECGTTECGLPQFVRSLKR